ncbi:MAG: response regulator [Cyanothece sp. SIO1E1]|nr:response regulator [Cyanothece sp. SIO1E1]
MTISSGLPRAADILIVDDTPDNLRLLSSMLFEQGYKVRKAINGQRALQAVEAIAPDLILLDIMMPDMKGYEVCLRLKESAATRDIPIIFISALDDEFDKVMAFDVGGVDYISKPFQLQEVLARVKHQIIIRHQQKQLEIKNEQLEQEISERQKAEADLRVFLHAVSHDLRNPVIGMSLVLKKLLKRARGQSGGGAGEAGEAEEKRPCVASVAVEEQGGNSSAKLKTQNSTSLISNSSPPASSITMPISMLELMDGSCDRQLSLINSLTETSQMEVWGTSLQCRSLNLADLARKLTDEWDLRLTERQAALDNQVPGDLPLVKADANQLWRVFENLIANALKYNPPGVKLTLAAAVVEAKEMAVWEDSGNGQAQADSETKFSAGNHADVYKTQNICPMVRCIVADDGVGMEPEAGASLFELYKRGDSSRKTQGLGLGLYLCRQIIAAHGGQIGVITNPNAGSRFWFTLPIWEA